MISLRLRRSRFIPRKSQNHWASLARAGSCLWTPSREPYPLVGAFSDAEIGFASPRAEVLALGSRTGLGRSELPN